MSKLALSMIVYDETDKLDKCLRSVKDYVDGIFILQTSTSLDTKKITESHGAKVKMNIDLQEKITRQDVKWFIEFAGWKPSLKVGDKLFFFDRARNEAMKMIPKDYKYFIWMDADDILVHGDKLKDVIAKLDDMDASAAYLNYIYEAEFGENGRVKNVLIEHVRERIIRNDGTYHWVGHIHENCIAISGEARQIDSKDVTILHMSSSGQKEPNLLRNMKVLEKTIINSKGKDPRPLYYLGKTHYDQHTPEDYVKAEKLIFRYLKGSGWDEERAQSYEYLAEIFRERGEKNKAIKACMNALVEAPQYPTTYLSLAVTYMTMGRFDRAMFWLKMAAKIPMPATTLVINPRDMAVRALEVMFNCSLRQSKLDEAWAAITKLVEFFPKDEKLIEQYNFLTELRQQRELSKYFVHLAKHLEANKEEGSIQALIAAAPASIRDNPIISEFIKKHRPSKVYPKKSVVIYCGAGFTPWNPTNLLEQNGSFVGGSEEAVIFAAKTLVKQGYQVTVFGDPGQEGTYDGVEYLNHFKFSSKDTFDILIVWRIPGMFDQKYNARKTYLWLHDVPNIVDMTENRLKNITKIMVLSKAHRELLEKIPDDKFFVTSNGYNEEFPNIKPTNIPTRCIWTSSYDRGLQHLLEMWKDVKKAVPKAELRIFYGWQLFNQFYNNNPERQVWKKKIEEGMKQPGVYHGGRLTQPELEKEYKQAGLWSYPTDFYEINCISAIKAQAFGAVPVCINYAALKDTVHFGYKIQGDIWEKETKELYTKTLITALKSNGERTKMMEWAKNTYTWDIIVKSWVEEFK